MLPEQLPWMTSASCRDHDAAMWDYPDVENRNDGDRLPEAARICLECPVRTQCGERAADTRKESGLWAGVLWLNGRRSRTIKPADPPAESRPPRQRRVPRSATCTICHRARGEQKSPFVGNLCNTCYKRSNRHAHMARAGR